MGFNGDDRKPIVPLFEFDWWQGDDGHTHGVSINPGFTFRATSRMQGRLTAGFTRNANDAQWYANYGVVGVDTTHYTFARLDQRTINVTARMDVTMTPTLTLQVYAQPFITTGHYGNWKELRDARNPEYGLRYQPFAAAADTLVDFNYKQFRSNTVLRWEYRPGSTLFFVWQQGRTQSDIDLGVFNSRNDATNLFRTQPANTFLIKASYWFSM
jgi:hypothetical protein